MQKRVFFAPDILQVILLHDGFVMVFLYDFYVSGIPLPDRICILLDNDTVIGYNWIKRKMR